jgi:hypothetical protein
MYNNLLEALSIMVKAAKKELTKKSAKPAPAKMAPAKAAPAMKLPKAAAPKAAPLAKTVLAKAVKATSATAKSTKKLEPKVKLAIESKKGADKKSEKLELKATEVPTGEKTEEEEEELEIANAGSAASNEAGIALAAATANAESAAGSLKNFRHHPDIENFYRFIYENDLRYEALEIIDVIAAQRTTHKNVKVAKGKAH